MSEVSRPKGRPGKFDDYKRFEAKLPELMTQRPLYFHGIGLFRGARSFTVWVKIKLPHGGVYKGRSIKPGGYIERKLGNRSSWDWEQLVAERIKLQGKADRNEPLEAVEVPTFAAYAAEWLERRKPSLRSFGVTRGNVNSVLVPIFGKKALNAITVTDVDRWLGKQSARLKSSSVQRQLNTFNAIMNSAVRNGLIERNPSQGAEKPKPGEARHRFVTPEQWLKILETVEAVEREQEEKKDEKPHQIRGWLRHFVVWAYQSGMRRGEIHALTWSNVLEGDSGTTFIEVTNTKSGKSRLVACTPEMNTIISALRKLERADGDERLFPVSMMTVKRSLTRLWKKTGLKDVRLHDLRRAHATILVNNNVDARTVSGRLGNSIGIMLKHYAVYGGDVEAAMLFGQATSKTERTDAAEETAGAEEGMAESMQV